MCGITGYIGTKENALEIVLRGLKNLEYRGYDSAGVAYFDENKIKLVKKTGKIKDGLESILNVKQNKNICIGHTRWATHGEPNDQNSHPHQMGSITLVHNGIIENADELKIMLEKQGYRFQSETDTEVLCGYLDFLYQQTKDMKEVLSSCQNNLKGSYACAIINDHFLDQLFVLKNKSPLIIGENETGYYLASDIPAILEETKNYYELKNQEFALLKKDQIQIFNKQQELQNKTLHHCTLYFEQATKQDYDTFMQKEIYEQPMIVKQLFDAQLDDCMSLIPDFAQYKKITIVGCGSSYHAGLVGKSLLEKYAKVPVSVEIASEYRYQDCLDSSLEEQNQLVVFISQSGETADTLACVDLAKQKGFDTLGIVNVNGSAIARNCRNVFYTNAGIEKAVATTKGYSTQVAILSMIALQLARYKHYMDKEEFKHILEDLKQLDQIMEQVLQNPIYDHIAQEIVDREDIFFIGRKIDYALAMEGSLKLKEITYIPSQAYMAGELKHGTISLIQKGTPVIGIITDPSISDKTVSNLIETKTRGAKVFSITTSDFKTLPFQQIILPAIHPLLQPLLTILPLQQIAYKVAELRKVNIDQPKNLAKSVTVE